ncbi:hypothetical protein EBR96_04970 [bacterium]|nr:hypothetical protein [bacterium]
MAFEAMSRGAKSAMLIDIAPQFAHRNRDAIFGRLKGNEQSEFLKNVTIYRNTIDRGLAKLPIQPDIIFLDPPYDKQGIYDDALQAISQFGILSPTGVLVVEFSRRIPVSTTLFQLKSQYTYSGVRVGMYVPHP